MLLLVKDDDLCWFIKYFVFLIVFTAWQVITWCIERLAVMHMDRGVWHIFSIITAAWWKTTFSIMFQSSMRGIIKISQGCKTFWQSQNIPLDKQITFLQIKPEAIIISASNELIFHAYLCFMRTGLLLLAMSANIRRIHTSLLLRALSFNDGIARWLFFYAVSYFQFS